MSRISIDDGPATLRHGVDKAVNSCPRDVRPSVEDCLAEICRCGWSGAHLVEPSLQLIPRYSMGSRCGLRDGQGMVQIIVVLEALHDPVCADIVLLQNGVSVAEKMGDLACKRLSIYSCALMLFPWQDFER